MGGYKHTPVGDALTKTEWEADDSHTIRAGTSFPSSPSDGDEFYRTDEHVLYLYDSGSSQWKAQGGQKIEADQVTALGDLNAKDGELIWDESNTYIPQGRLENNSLTVAGNSVSLGSSTAVDYIDLADTGTSFPIPNSDLANSSITVAGNSISLGGSSGVAYVDLSDTGASFPILNSDLSNNSVTVAGNSVALGNSTTVNLSDLADTLGVSGGIKMDASGNLTAGTADRICIETDTGRVLYDNGASFVEVGLSESQISLANLGSRAHSDLSDAPTNAHINNLTDIPTRNHNDTQNISKDDHLPILASGTITLTGGQTPAYDGALGLALSQTKYLDVVLAPQDPSWDLDYAFNHDWGRRWDNSTGEMDVYLTVNWDNDPGSGNDLTLDYKIIER